MKNTWKSLLAAGAMTLSLTGSAFAATPATLTDINNSYAKDQITKLYNAGIITGDENHHYNPTSTMTRQQLAIVLSKALGLTPDATADGTFTDVADWAKPYVGALVKAGIASGYDAKTFGGNDPVTREQLALFFVRAFGATDLTKELNMRYAEFDDFEQIDTYAVPYVGIMHKLGFLNGYATLYGTDFNPKGNADRQAVAHLVSEFYFNKDAYTTKLDDITTILGIMKQTDQAMKSIQSVSLATTSTTNDPNNQDPPTTQTIDVTFYPLTSHGEIKTAQTTGAADMTVAEWYLENGILYYQDDQTGKWYKKDVTSDIQELASEIPQASIWYDYSMAPDYTITSNQATDTLTHKLPDILGTDANGKPHDSSMSDIYVIDKQTHLLKTDSTVMTDQGIIHTDLTTLTYNTLQPITVPQTIKDTAILQSTPTDASQAPAQEMQLFSQLLSR